MESRHIHHVSDLREVVLAVDKLLWQSRRRLGNGTSGQLHCVGEVHAAIVSERNTSALKRGEGIDLEELLAVFDVDPATNGGS